MVRYVRFTDLGRPSANMSLTTRRVGLAHHLAEITVDSDVGKIIRWLQVVSVGMLLVIKREEWRNGPSHALLRASGTFH
jgi:hypothetical protein